MGKKIKFIPTGIFYTLEDLPNGSMFRTNDKNQCIALKSEYTTKQGAIEAIILGSKEMFWGGAETAENQRKIKVEKLDLVFS